MKPIVHDIYCGLGGWAEGFISEGYESIGYDIEKHDYGTGTYPGTLILCDARSIHGSQCKDAAVIVASPPCQEPSYRAMPWKRAKALNAIGPPHNFIELFNACFRIQREASEAAGHYIPLIVENVCGAQKWVGRARWHFGSYYLWGDIPALMPITIKGRKVSGFRFDGSGGSLKTASVKVSGQDWNRHAKTGETSPHWRMEGLKIQPPPGHTGWFGDYQSMKAAQDAMDTKQGGDWFGAHCESSMSRRFSSKSKARARASAEIAKIPFPLAQHIARCFKPQRQAVSA